MFTCSDSYTNVTPTSSEKRIFTSPWSTMYFFIYCNIIAWYDWQRSYLCSKDQRWLRVKKCKVQGLFMCVIILQTSEFPYYARSKDCVVLITFCCVRFLPSMFVCLELSLHNKSTRTIFSWKNRTKEFFDWVFQFCPSLLLPYKPTSKGSCCTCRHDVLPTVSTLSLILFLFCQEYFVL